LQCHFPISRLDLAAGYLLGGVCGPTRPVAVLNSENKCKMGIPGLLEQLKSIVQKRHVGSFKGLRVAVDASCWLHRGSYSCAQELALGTGTLKYVAFFMKMVNLLVAAEVQEIIIVFDGLPLPSKSDTNEKRSKSRKSNLELARCAEEKGDLQLAQTHYQRGISVTKDMVQRVIAELQRNNILYMISPYESDAQLAFMSKSGLVDVIISEDSDTLVYGCRHVFLKMDREGNGDLIERNDLGKNAGLSFVNWTDDQFKLFCCLGRLLYMYVMCMCMYVCMYVCICINPSIHLYTPL
jgi:exonuclease-1